MGKIITIIIVVVLVVVGALWWLRNYGGMLLSDSNNSLQQPIASSETAVSYTDSGFVPKSVVVKPGTTVTFVNNSSGQMWVASAVHPTHQELPGLDQLEAVGAGGKYAYTFTKVGNWRYHNHYLSAQTGTIVVREQ